MADDSNDQPPTAPIQHVLTDEEYARLLAHFARLPAIEAEIAEAHRFFAEEDAARAAAAQAAADEPTDEGEDDEPAQPASEQPG